MGVFGRALQNELRALTWNRVFGEDNLGRTYTGRALSEETALKYSVVYAATTLIVDAVSTLPPLAFVELEDGKLEKKDLPAWVRSPHPDMRRSDVFAQILTGALLWGNGIALKTRRPSDGVINGLIPIASSRVTIEWDPNSGPGLPNGFGLKRRYKIDNGEWMGPDRIMHIQGFTLPGEPKGMSMIGQAREAISLGLTLEEFGARYFAQGSMHKVVLQTPERLDLNQAKQLVQNYESFHKGPRNWHRPAVASGGVTIQNVSIPPEDAQFLQSREFQAIDVARWFRVPPHRVGIIDKQTSWGTGLAEENTAMTQMTFRPWVTRMEAALTKDAAGGEDRGLLIRLDDKALMRGSTKDQVEAWSAAMTGGFVTKNEARDGALGLGPMEGGDELPKPEEIKQNPLQNLKQF